MLKPLALDLAEGYYGNNHGIMGGRENSEVRQFFIRAALEEWKKAFRAGFFDEETGKKKEELFKISDKEHVALWLPETLQSSVWGICRLVEEKKGLTREKIMRALEILEEQNSGIPLNFEELDAKTQNGLLRALYLMLDERLRAKARVH